MRVLLTTIAFVLTTSAAMAGYVGFPSQEQLNQCKDAWNNSLSHNCEVHKAACEQRGGVFENKIRDWAGQVGADGGHWTWVRHWCSKGGFKW
jgi:hypothetical protein